jgi:large subunit ribosomal protein L9
MEIILTTDYPALGYKGDILKVKPGYARNYLFPNKFAIVATPSNKKILAENQKQAAHKIEQAKTEAQTLANTLNDLTLTIIAKTGANGKIFGSITTLQIAQNLKEKGFDIDRRKISLTEEIKTTGEYSANIDLHREVKAKITLNIIEEA